MVAQIISKTDAQVTDIKVKLSMIVSQEMSKL